MQFIIDVSFFFTGKAKTVSSRWILTRATSVFYAATVMDRVYVTSSSFGVKYRNRGKL